MTLVVDASAVVAALVDGDADGQWAEAELASQPLAAPHLLPVEVANVLRRAARKRLISADTAALAHADLLQLRIELFPYELVALRVWELRATLSAYDAWYVALAESLGARLATLDRKLSRATGPRCKFALPPRPNR
jgi:predicted nucleic acid-binding protein